MAAQMCSISPLLSGIFLHYTVYAQKVNLSSTKEVVRTSLTAQKGVAAILLRARATHLLEETISGAFHMDLRYLCSCGPYSDDPIRAVY